jgi:hypothetical protein
MSAPAVPVQAWKSVLYFEWKRHGRHLEEYASEFIGTAFMVFCVVGVVGLMFAPRSLLPAVLPSMRLRLFLTGLVLGGSGWLVAISPPGKLRGTSKGHYGCDNSRWSFRQESNSRSDDEAAPAIKAHSSACSQIGNELTSASLPLPVQKKNSL